MKHTLLPLALLCACLNIMSQHLSGVNWSRTDWMANLPDEAYVCQLSLPGAHDAATGEGWTGLAGIMAGNINSKAQDVKVSVLYNNGVRVIDLRPTTYNGKLYNSHGITVVNKTVESLLDEMIAFLDKHPTEFFIFHVYQGGSEWEPTPFRELITKEKYASRLKAFSNNLTVGEMRGKLLFLCRHDHDGKPWPGGYLRDWSGLAFEEGRKSYINSNGASGYPFDIKAGYVQIQDLAGVEGDEELQHELKAITDLLDYSTSHVVKLRRDCIWTFNFASGCSKSGIGGISLSDGYRNNATFTNKLILDYLTAPDYKPGPTGMIMMDYACVETTKFNDNSYATNGNTVYGQTLVDAIIDNNFRCELKQLMFPSTATAISARQASSGESSSTFTLSGTKVAHPTKGSIYIQNGKKTLQR